METLGRFKTEISRMLIRVGYEIRFETESPTPMLVMLSIHPSRNRDLKTPHRVNIGPDIPVYDYVDAFGNICTRLTVPAGGATLSTSFVIEDDGLADTRAPQGPPVPVQELPNDVLLYLLGSRYCEPDRLMQIAWTQFGGIFCARALIEAIVDFVHHQIQFGYEHARCDRTAWEASRNGGAFAATSLILRSPSAAV